MALINCTECNHQISDKAAACVKCGAPVVKKETIHCFECNTVLEKGTKTCTNCGGVQIEEIPKKVEEIKKEESKEEKKSEPVKEKESKVVEKIIIKQVEKPEPLLGGLFRFLRIAVIVIVILVVAFLAYDFYMKNSGIENRIRYENQKREFRNSNLNPLKESREERRERRKEKIRRFLNGE